MPGGASGADRFLVVGLGNPGQKYARTRHNVGFRVAAELADRWQMSPAKDKYRARIAEGRTRPGGPRVVLLQPQTYMNESGDSAGPARGRLRIPLDHVIAVHDEIDLPFGEIRTRLGGGLAGHNGLKSLKQGFGSPSAIGKLLLERFLIAFEAASLLLLIAAIGAVVLAGRHRVEAGTPGREAEEVPS